MIVLLKDGDYENILTKWWVARDFPVPPKDYLSDTGYMVWDGDVPVCAAFLYGTNSKIAWCTWVISNPDYRGKKDALMLLITFMVEVARGTGYKYIYAPAKNSRLLDVLDTLGFVRGDKMEETIKIL